LVEVGALLSQVVQEVLRVVQLHRAVLASVEELPTTAQVVVAGITAEVVVTLPAVVEAQDT
jgi:hypothetical protein